MWKYFDLITYISVCMWVISGIMIYSKQTVLRRLSIAGFLVASLALGTFMVLLWRELERPPMRTLAETRFWYGFFMGVIGYALYLLYKYKWILSYAAAMAITFVMLTYLYPDTMNKTLMPALQSVWFIPHVIVYIFAYAMLGMASLTAFYGIYCYKKGKETQKGTETKETQKSAGASTRAATQANPSQTQQFGWSLCGYLRHFGLSSFGSFSGTTCSQTGEIVL